MEGLRGLQARGRFTLPASHEALLREFTVTAAPLAKFLEEQCWVHRSLDPGDLPAHCLTDARVSVKKGILHQEYEEWCANNGVEPRDAAYFGKDLKAVLTKLATNSTERGQDGELRHIYKGLGLRQATERSALEQALLG